MDRGMECDWMECERMECMYGDKEESIPWDLQLPFPAEMGSLVMVDGQWVGQ